MSKLLPKQVRLKSRAGFSQNLKSLDNKRGSVTTKNKPAIYDSLKGLEPISTGQEPDANFRYMKKSRYMRMGNAPSTIDGPKKKTLPSLDDFKNGFSKEQIQGLNKNQSD